MTDRHVQDVQPRRIVNIPAGPPVKERRASVSPVKPTETELRVGRHISLKGQIDACDVLSVEGTVEAGFSGRLVNVSESGRVTGCCEVEQADIRGRFDGELTVTKVLRIHERGWVQGKIRYARVEISGGGVLAGDVGRLEVQRPVKVLRPSAIAPR